jgi:hypothetical protein
MSSHLRTRDLTYVALTAGHVITLVSRRLCQSSPRHPYPQPRRYALLKLDLNDTEHFQFSLAIHDECQFTLGMRGYPSRRCLTSFLAAKTRDFAATSKAIQACGSQDRSINRSIRCDGTTDRAIEASDDDGHSDGDIHLMWEAKVIGVRLMTVVRVITRRTY